MQLENNGSPFTAFSQQQNVIGARNMGCFVGQEVTEGILGMPISEVESVATRLNS